MGYITAKLEKATHQLLYQINATTDINQQLKLFYDYMQKEIICSSNIIDYQELPTPQYFTRKFQNIFNTTASLSSQNLIGHYSNIEIKEKLLPQYSEHFHKFDHIGKQIYFNTMKSESKSGLTFLDQSKSHPEFFNDYIQKMNCNVTYFGGFTLTPSLAVHMVIGRMQKDEPAFSTTEHQIIQLVFNSLVLACRNTYRLYDNDLAEGTSEHKVDLSSALFNMLDEYLLVIDRDGKIITTNDYTMRLLAEWKTLPIQQGKLGQTTIPALLEMRIRQYIEGFMAGKIDFRQSLEIPFTLLPNLEYNLSCKSIIPEECRDNRLYFFLRIEPISMQAKCWWLKHLYKLTERETQVVQEFANTAGTSSKIADNLRLSPHTVNDYFKQIMRKMRVNKREAILYHLRIR